MYDYSTPWRGQGQATPSQIDGFFREQNPIAPALGSIIVSEATAAGLNPDLVAAQVCLETGYWTSDWALNHNNPAGLGVTGQAGVGLSFASIQAGIHAQCAHLLTYTLGDANPLKADDPRHSAVPKNLLGKCIFLGDFGNGIWAEDPNYAAKLINRANALLTFAQKDNLVTDLWPTQADLGVPLTIQKADADIGPARAVSDVWWFIVHDTEGHRDSDLQILEHADPAQASVHFWISLAGEVVAIVPINYTAWTVANQSVDPSAINVELEGFARNGATEPQYQSLARVFLWCRSQGMDVPSQYVGKQNIKGIIGHQDVADPNHPGQWGGASHHTDPGPLFRWQHLTDLIDGTAAAQPTAAQYLDDQTGKKIVLGFLDFWNSLNDHQNNYRLLGRPITDEFVAKLAMNDQEYTYQVFERAVITWHGDAAPPWDRFVVFPDEAAAVRAYAEAQGLTKRER